MIVYSSLLILVCFTTVSTKTVPVKESCEESKTHFFVTDNASLQSSDSIVYKATSEDECLKICTTNRDKYNRPITCNSFTYDHASFQCSVHTEKAVPIGSAQIETSVGKRYFEKTCISYKLPESCHQSQFIRVDQSVLVGYAVNMTLTDSIESCVAQCVQETDCKSAMYFYEDGECITNKESALTKPSGFTKEENDRVIYFQNGCNVKEALDMEEKQKMVTESDEEIRPPVNIQISETTPKPESPVEKKIETMETEEPVAEEEEETNGNEETDDEYEDESQEKIENDHTTTTEATTTTTEEPEPETEAPRKLKPSLQKKIKKHPKNFGSKTYEILKKETFKKTKMENPEIEPLEDSSKISEELEETYFSEWSTWTPCTKSNERQVRRRRCLNLRKCLGALMQVQNCPEVIPTTTPQNNEMIRSVVSVDGDEYDDQMPVDNISVDPIPVPAKQPILNEQVWGSWQGTCQQFASSQPCNNGSMIGFESRECIAKDPAQCEGPFFRYCTLRC